MNEAARNGYRSNVPNFLVNTYILSYLYCIQYRSYKYTVIEKYDQLILYSAIN